MEIILLNGDEIYEILKMLYFEILWPYDDEVFYNWAISYDFVALNISTFKPFE